VRFCIKSRFGEFKTSSMDPSIAEVAINTIVKRGFVTNITN